ncbi:CynX/NimT family MFS transporter [Paenibacillus xerothermodurans]|uniref:MFS transporter n=1 Tax=Paenibacillus xerothermodurans TaxID=1977292 RepID=A0A2W1NAN6_PAEXE|nr:MFS transporter [Paenibacillus xerothermodurans]PZE21739.1 MFS transporter [Paenibacillus xerothermodurans]
MIVNEAQTSQPVRSRIKTAWLVLGILLVAANLRAAITGLGPLVEAIRADTDLSNAITGMLTALPLFAFAALSPIAPKIAQRIGMEKTLFASLIVLTLGILMRSYPTVLTLFIGTFIIGLAIAIGNVLLPGLIKRDFAGHVGAMTGAYSVSMNIFGALASGISVPLSVGAGLGWRGSLASWAVLGGLAILCWLPQLRARHTSYASAAGGSIWRSALAWQVTLFMGLQSWLFYINATWLPEILHQRGMNVAEAGWMLSAMQFVSLPTSFIVPILAAHRASQRGIVIVTVLFHLIGYLGLLSGNTSLVWVWIICIGIAVGSSISLALAFFGLRTRSAQQASELSGMAQSIGYLLAAFGPISFGFFHDLTQAWAVPLMTLVIVSVLLLAVGLGAGRSGYVTSSRTEGPS